MPRWRIGTMKTLGPRCSGHRIEMVNGSFVALARAAGRINDPRPQDRIDEARTDERSR
jgi:hypothetical protein